MRVPAPAKINLHLRVGPRRDADGFHPLLTWMTTVALFDTLTLVRRPSDVAARGDRDPFVLSCDEPSLPTDGRNLVVIAAIAPAGAAASEPASRAGDSRTGEGSTGVASTTASTGAASTGASLSASASRVSAFLAKRIPSGAGLGGGSSDAAAALVGLNALWKLDLSASRLSAIAASLGSDVPFFLGGASSICTGRGEIVRPVARLDMKWAMLVL